MPLGYAVCALSTQSWISQWKRVERWKNRVLELKDKSHDKNGLSPYDLDIFYSFLLNIYSLKDWIIDCEPSIKEEVCKLYAETTELRICADYCNVIKHRTLTRPICDPNIGWFRAVEHLDPINPHRYYIGYEFKYLTSEQIKEAGIELPCLKDKFKNYISNSSDRIIISADFSDYRNKEIFGEYYEKLRGLFSKYPSQAGWKKIELFEFVNNCCNFLDNFLKNHLFSSFNNDN